jgi:hypothetical protein
VSFGRSNHTSGKNLPEVKSSAQKSDDYECLQIVESLRDEDRVRQKVIGTLGRTDKILASDKFDTLIRSAVERSGIRSSRLALS